MSAKDDLQKKRLQLNERQVALLAKRRQGLSASQKESTLIIPRRPENATIPASFVQQRLWFLTQLEGESATYNEFTALRIKGPLHNALFEQTLQEIRRRHEILRTSLVMVDRQLRQVIDDPDHSSLYLSLIDLSTQLENTRAALLEQKTLSEMRHPFKLAQETLWRNTLFKLAEDDHLFLMVMHHAICDAWSLDILKHEFMTLYNALRNGQPSPLSEPAIQYADYSCWQHATYDEKAQQKHLAYWKHHLGKTLPTLDLPTDRPRPATQSNHGRRKYFVYPLSFYHELQAFNHREGVTLFMTLLAGFHILLSRYTDSGDLVIGTSITGRTWPEIENLVGLFTNTLPLYTQVSPHLSFREVVQLIRNTALAAYAHQDVPFEKIVAEVSTERDLSHSPLFQVMFILQNLPASEVEFPDFSFSLPEIDNQTAKFDLELDIQETAKGLKGYIEYNSDLFDESTITQMIDHLHLLIQNALKNPERPNAHLTFLTPVEELALLDRWKSNHIPYPQQCYHELFEAQVERTPDAIAVVDAEGHLTYREINVRANRLANYLHQTGVGTDTLVAILAERGWRFITAILAIFKAGGAYLPLDPTYPAARLHYMLEHSGCRLVLATSTSASSLALAGQTETPHTLNLIDDLLQQSEFSCAHLDTPTTLQQLAYVIYTSGSTGLPKGVMIEQRGMINHLYAKITDLKLTEADCLAQTASQCFDISVWQMLAPLILGARVDIFPDEVAHDPLHLFQEVVSHQITIMETVPALLQITLAHLQRSGVASLKLEALRWLLLTGEALPPDLIERWFNLYPRIPLLNAYGPTECSDDVTHHLLSTTLAPDVLYTPIGRAVANTQLYILSRSMELMPPGACGELYVGGDGVGRGYLNDATRTSEAFVPDPFNSQATNRLYKTGDLVRWLPDGTLTYLGRVDTQVKVRGYRIEPGEIEAILLQAPRVEQCAVLVQADAIGQKRLVAYITTHQANQTAQLSRSLTGFLKERLPEYMVPSAFVVLDTLPLSTNGKIDRQALLALKQAPIQFEELTEMPASPLEEVLAFIWAEVLEVTQVDRKKRFFELGGHSLLAAQVMARMDEIFGLDFPLRWIFEEPTIAGLARLILQNEQLRERIEKTASMFMQILKMSEGDVEMMLNGNTRNG